MNKFTVTLTFLTKTLQIISTKVIRLGLSEIVFAVSKGTLLTRTVAATHFVVKAKAGLKVPFSFTPDWSIICAGLVDDLDGFSGIILSLLIGFANEILLRRGLLG